jgi:hypothetical protein
MNGKSEGTGMCLNNSCRWQDVPNSEDLEGRRIQECPACNYRRYEEINRWRRRKVQEADKAHEEANRPFSHADVRAVCDKLDFLGRFVVAGIVRSCVKSNSDAVRLALQIEAELKK